MSITFFKDFHKETKNLLNNNYTAGGKWKIESKIKASEKQVTINPSATDAGAACDIEYKFDQKMLPAGVKVSFANFDMKNITAYLTNKGHKFELVSDPRLNSPTFTHEAPNFNKMSVINKITKNDAEILASTKAMHGLQIGGGGSYAFKNKALKWRAGARYTSPYIHDAIVDVLCNNLQSYTFGAIIPYQIKTVIGSVALDVEYAKNTPKVTVGGEVTCPYSGGSMRVRANNDKQASLAFIINHKSWTSAITINNDMKIGAQLLFSVSEIFEEEP